MNSSLTASSHPQTSNMLSISDLDTSKINLTLGNTGRVFINYGDKVKNPVTFSMGGKGELLSSTYGLNKPFPSAKPGSRRNFDIDATPELCEATRNIMHSIIQNPRAPMWCRDLESPLRSDGTLRVKVDEKTNVTLLLDGKVGAVGNMVDLTPNCCVAMVVRLSDPWSITKEDGATLHGISFIVTDILVRAGESEAPPTKKMKW